jgi:SMODS-associated and fused to various effectors sensor domain
MSNGLPSASGARLAGDDYQHVLTWIHALKLLLTDGDVTRIEFEADNAGNVDDLIVHRVRQPPLYHQIKFVVAQKQPLTHEWFTTPPKRGKKSPLQRFYESYTKLTSPPEMALHTNRLPAPGDPMLRLVSGSDCKLVPRLAAQKPGSAAGKVRKQWAEHLGIAEGQLLSFLGHLAIRSGREALDDLQERCAWAMRAVGFRPDAAALLAAIGALRELIRTGVRELDAESVQRVADTLQLLAGTPRATLLVQSLRPDPWPETATASVDWVELFEGDDAASRRQLKDPAGWNDRLKPELAAAVEQLRKARLTDVDVRGTMRLATGLVVGVQLSEVAGFKVAAIGREGEWTSITPRDARTVDRERIEIDQGEDLAIAIAVSQPIRDDVVSYIRTKNLHVEELVVYSPPGGPSREAVESPEAGIGLAAAISGALRADTSSRRGGLHLFQAGPLPLAIMIGHLWNRMPQTQVYEDLGPGEGYAATFTI